MWPRAPGPGIKSRGSAYIQPPGGLDPRRIHLKALRVSSDSMLDGPFVKVLLGTASDYDALACG